MQQDDKCKHNRLALLQTVHLLPQMADRGTALPVHTEPNSTAADSEFDTEAADTADIVSTEANAYAADPVFADECTKQWMSTDRPVEGS